MSKTCISDGKAGKIRNDLLRRSTNEKSEKVGGEMQTGEKKIEIY